jgi:hypothetical protein
MSSLLQISGELPQDHLPCQFARPDQQRHDSRKSGVNSTYGLVLSVGAVDSPSDGSGLTGSGVRRGTSVGSGVGVASGSALSDGASVAGAGVAGAAVAGACVAGACVAGASVVTGACVSGIGVRLPAVRAAETTRALPAAASEAITRPKAVANAAIGRITRLRRPGGGPSAPQPGRAARCVPQDLPAPQGLGWPGVLRRSPEGRLSRLNMRSSWSGVPEQQKRAPTLREGRAQRAPKYRCRRSYMYKEPSLKK